MSHNTFTVYMQPNMQAALKVLASALGLSVSETVRIAVAGLAEHTSRTLDGEQV